MHLTQRVALDPTDPAGDEDRCDGVPDPVTREATDRVWHLFLQKLAAQHPEHPWLKAERPADTSADADPAGVA